MPRLQLMRNGFVVLAAVVDMLTGKPGLQSVVLDHVSCFRTQDNNWP